LPRCAKCGRELRQDARFCAGCGAQVSAADDSEGPVSAGGAEGIDAVGAAADQPPGAALPARILLPVGAVLGLLLVLCVVVVVRRSGGFTAPPQPPVPTITTAAAPAPIVTTDQQPSLSAADALREQVGADQPVVASILGRWVPQISAKAPGTVADGITYDESSIWAQFQDNRSRYPSVVLLRSDDYGSFKVGGYWITIVAIPYDDAASANAWCDAQNLGPDDCFAKRVADAPGPGPDTVHRN